MYYNGATFDGFVDRPRQQFNLASNWFLTPGGRSHDVKVGFDFQNLESGAEFKYPNSQQFIAEVYNQATGAIVPFQRLDFEAGPSVSNGKVYALFARDKFQVTNRFFVEAGPPLGTTDWGERRRHRHCRHQRARATPLGQLRSVR